MSTATARRPFAGPRPAPDEPSWSSLRVAARHRPKRVLEREAPDPAPQTIAFLDRRPEVNAGIDPRGAVLLLCARETVVAAGRSGRHRRERRHTESVTIGARETAQDFGRRGTGDAVG